MYVYYNYNKFHNKCKNINTNNVKTQSYSFIVSINNRRANAQQFHVCTIHALWKCELGGHSRIFKNLNNNWNPLDVFFLQRIVRFFA